MARGRTNPVMVTKVGAAGAQRSPDRVVAEEPMQIHLDGTLVTTTMRTPGHDYELAVGFLFTEGLLAGAPVQQVRYCATGSAVDTEFNVVSVDTGGKAPVPAPRLTVTTSSCGICGTESIDALVQRLAPRTAPPPAVDVEIAVAVARAVRAQQELFAITGSVHAAAAYDRGTAEVLVLREDVGRHNAVDKVIGRLVLDGAFDGDPDVERVGRNAGSQGLFVSGRVSFEIVQKAWAAGFAEIVAVSGPTGLAVDTARRANVALAGFLRDGTCNIYVP